MKESKLSFIVGLIVVFAAAASYGYRGGPGAGPDTMGTLFQDLSAEQRAAIREITLKHQKEMIQLRAEMETKNLELQELVRADAAKDAIFAKLDELGALRTEIMKKRMEMRLEIRAQLTDEQKEMFDQKHTMMGYMGAGGGRSPRGPGGRGPAGAFE